MKSTPANYRCTALLLLVPIASSLHAQTPLWMPRTSFICDWSPQPPAAKRLVVDLLVQQDVDVNRPPTFDDIQAVQALRGRILHQFKVAILRAELDTGAVRLLITGDSAIATAAYGVSDTLTFDARLQIFYTRPITEDDEAALRALGGSPLNRASVPVAIPVLFAVAPDSLIPRVATLPGVRLVRAAGVSCMTPD